MGSCMGKEKKIAEWKQAVFFAYHDLIRQKGRTAFIAAVFVVMAAVSFLFIGELSVYGDDRITKRYDTSAFPQKNDKRLSVRRYDGKVMTRKDRKKLRAVRYIVDVDLNDYVNDIQYDTSLKMKGYSFMRSAAGFTQKDLKEGRLPGNRGEIVVSEDARIKLGETKRYYFASENMWGNGKKCWFDMKVVGIRRKKGKQVYFSPEFCHMLTPAVDGYSFQTDYDQDEITERYTKSRDFVPVIGDGLKGAQARVSKNYHLSYITDHNGNPMSVRSAFCGKELPFHVCHSTNTATEEVVIQKKKEKSKLIRSGSGYLEYQMDMSDQGGNFVEVSAELFEKMYPDQCAQASVYISHYSKTDKVIRALNKQGYDAISTYRVSATEYIMAKVFKRIYIILLSVVILSFLTIMMVLLLRQIIKAQRDQIRTLRLIGMHREPLELTVYLEMLFVELLSAIVVLVSASIGCQRFGIVRKILDYQTTGSITGYFVYNLAVGILAIYMALKKIRSSLEWQKGRK